MLLDGLSSPSSAVDSLHTLRTARVWEPPVSGPDPELVTPILMGSFLSYVHNTVTCGNILREVFFTF